MGRENINSIIFQISKNTGVSVKKIQDMLYILNSGKAIDNIQLIQTIGVSRNALNQVKSLLSKYLKEPYRNTQLNPDGKREIKNMFLSNEHFPEELLFSLLENQQYRDIIEFLRGIQKSRPTPNREYDQFTATVETTARRAALLNFFADIEGKKILLLGDDDFTSIAIARYGKAEEVTVLDIDKRVLDGIENISTLHKLGIKIVEYDARKTLPRDLLGKYDIVFTDPPYTVNGISLFVSRAIEVLDTKNQAARLYLSYGNSDRAKERFIPIYNNLVDSGLMIRWVFDKFNRYNGAEEIGSASSLYICEITPKMHTLVNGEYDKSIYTNN